ncbi:MAG: phage holin family protein, partial [Pirellulaceae bacterium]
HKNGKSLPPAAMARDASQVAHDVVELAELHSSLLLLETKTAVQQLVTPLVLLAVGGVMAVCSLLVLLLSGAWALAEFTTLSLSISLLIVGGGTMLIAVVVALAGWAGLKRLQSPFEESSREFRRNVNWFKTAVREARRSPRTHVEEPDYSSV